MLTARTIRGYELRDEIGKGGFGAVYLAYQAAVARDVAIKIIRPRFANHPDFIRRFEAEAHLIARLEHPYIVPLYDFWREPDGAYLVMRWLRGGNHHHNGTYCSLAVRAGTMLLATRQRSRTSSALSLTRPALTHLSKSAHRSCTHAN